MKWRLLSWKYKVKSNKWNTARLHTARIQLKLWAKIVKQTDKETDKEYYETLIVIRIIITKTRQNLSNVSEWKAQSEWVWDWQERAKD